MIANSDEIIFRFSDWALNSISVEAALIFGSRARSSENIAGSDSCSDVDFQIVTYSPSFFADKNWMKFLGNIPVSASVYRHASGGAAKATVLFNGGVGLDVVVIPAFRMHLARVAVAFGIHRKSSALARSLDELSTVLSGGYKIVKGGRRWSRFYSAVVKEIRGDRISDLDVLDIANEFFCDYEWTQKKIKRGELIAAQRMLHRSLLEINFKLYHECRMRRSLPSFREARRVEFLLGRRELDLLSVECALNRDSLFAATRRCSLVMQEIVADLVGDRWRWPPQIS